MTLRSTTNLVVPKDVQLDRKELKSGFLYFYNKGYVGKEPIFMNRLWLASVFPEIANNPSFGKNPKGLRTWSAYAAKHTHAGFLSLKKVNDLQDPHFVVSVPLAEFNRYNVTEAFERYKMWFTEPAKTGDVYTNESAESLQSRLKDGAESSNVLQQVIPAAEAINNAHLDAKGRHELQQSLLRLRVAFKGSLVVIFADFKVTAPIAQQLTTQSWIEIRAIDLYPLLLQWVAGQFGYTVNTPLAAFPISKIARTLPPVLEGQARIDTNNLTIDPKGLPMWVPAKLDNTSRYEDLYSQVGDKGDGSFGLLDIDSAAELIMEGKDLKPKLPANIPVLIDWVNNKYAYTLSTGMLKIQDLSRFKAADAAHVRNIMKNTWVDWKLISQISAMASSSGVPDVIRFEPSELAAIANVDSIIANKLSSEGGTDVETYYGYAEKFFQNNANDIVTMKDISNTGDEIFRPLSRYFVQAHAAVVANMDAVNARYSVSFVASHMGYLTIWAKYATNLGHVELEANKLCKAAMDQGVDKDWEPPTIPLLSDNKERPIGLLPHQKKVRNLLKDSPDFAILPVQAGGGKSVLAITDVLYEIKANRSQPYLILCPSHLVAQYVKEIVFFTAGKLNAVPINTYTIARNGFERLTKLLEGAPRNTVVVCDYDALRGRQENVCYGTTSVVVYPVIEFLRQFNFGYALLDESHVVKNDSQRTRACMALIADIPKKRLASGTMAHDSPSDLAVQISMLDPTLFGSKEAFNAKFGAKVRGDRVIEWLPGAQQQIMKTIMTRVVVAKAMRKEWAALLPQAEENFFGVNLTHNQQAVYQSILESSLEKMRADAAKGNKTLQKFFAKRGEKIEVPQPGGDEGLNEEADEEAEDAADENAGSDLEALLGFYLARLEQYITAPARDPLGAKLEGEDRRSPKVNKIIERIYVHLKGGFPGKVLVFTNYTESAEEIYEALPPDLKAMAILYVAADKVESGAAFENDASKKIMIGVENSMNTGLNFQHVSRLIRTETVWNPGTLEQGNSRVNRPELKKAERRERIFYDWIVADNTLDITKVSRLISKVIAVAKFENADDPAYEEIPEVDIIPMNVESITEMNNWSLNLQEYGDAYKNYNQVKHDDYKAYREVHGELTMAPIPLAPNPPDAKLLGSVPYTPGLELYGAGELGLVRVDEFLRQDSAAEEGEEGPDEDDAEGIANDKQKRLQESIATIIGQAVHTEFGDGIIKSVMVKSRKLDILLPAGYMVRVSIASAFVITRTTTSTKDIRNQLLKQVGQMPLTTPIDIPGPTFRRDNLGMRRAEKEREAAEKEALKIKQTKLKSLSIELAFNVSNGFLGVTYFVNEKHPEAKNALQALGFRPTPPFAMAQVKTSRQLIKQFNVWEEAGFHLDKSMGNIASAFLDLSKILQGGKIAQGILNFKFSTRNSLKNFFRDEVKPSTSKDLIKPYPMIEDGAAYIVLPLRGQPASVRALKIKAPGVRWSHSEDSLVYYGLDLAATSAKIKEILGAGIQISNIEDLKAEFKKLKKVKIRNSEADEGQL